MAIYYSGDPRLDRHIAILGHITHEWNGLETAFEILPWLYSTDPLSGILVTRLSSRSVEEAANAMADRREKRPAVKEAIKFAFSALNILRENRNILVHSYHMSATSQSDVQWHRKSKRDPIERISSKASLRDLSALLTCMRRLDAYISTLIAIIASEHHQPGMEPYEDGTPPLPRKFPLPRRLAQN